MHLLIWGYETPRPILLFLHPQFFVFSIEKLIFFRYNIHPSVSDATNWDNVKGASLFFRARGFLTALWNWARIYDSGTANSDLGVPLR